VTTTILAVPNHLPTLVDVSCATVRNTPDGDLRAMIPEDGLVISEEMCRSDDLPGVVDGDRISKLVKDHRTRGQLDDGILRSRGLRDDLHCRHGCEDEQRRHEQSRDTQRVRDA
jgi:hypothetical protein